jgi:hypothetical protein
MTGRNRNGKRKNLIRLGIPPGQDYSWSRSRMDIWAVGLRISVYN